MLGSISVLKEGGAVGEGDGIELWKCFKATREGFGLVGWGPCARTPAIACSSGTAAEAANTAVYHVPTLPSMSTYATDMWPLRAKGVVDADDNLDCWDTNPYEICTRHVAALNEKDPAAMWRVVDLFARDEG